MVSLGRCRRLVRRLRRTRCSPPFARSSLELAGGRSVWRRRAAAKCTGCFARRELRHFLATLFRIYTHKPDNSSAPTHMRSKAKLVFYPTTRACMPNHRQIHHHHRHHRAQPKSQPPAGNTKFTLPTKCSFWTNRRSGPRRSST
jgi:hypothetical protein